MKNRKFTQLLTTLIVVLLFGCAKDPEGTQRQMQLQSVGYTGTMPNGWQFGKTNIIANNSVKGPSAPQDGSYILHSFTVADTLNGYSIIVELPLIKYSNDYIADTDLPAAVKSYYPYDRVKEKLAVGNKILLSMLHRDVTTGFRLQMRDDKNYSFYGADYAQDATSYLKITELIEGTEPDPVLGQVKTLEVIFEINALMTRIYPAEPGLNPAAPVKGLLRMKYREL
ncbi:hypothetical protein [Adhaeribacter pallidiroseus]|uniref:Uncharacterized protein n=1 Tax=Adhaeribacter pallidiroseus TaxID=2072847 RepID=A0A369QN77_9BACT|nr:hypothetical protein [Adhaeribacter pallidiroseus]RDC66204.1 hypothetical protein AHMF7616_04835 [Adhaeribacter pallidiroseus]